MKKILLVWPYIEKRKIHNKAFMSIVECVPPLGIAYLASYLEPKGYLVDILDASLSDLGPLDLGDRYRQGLSDEEIFQYIKTVQPEVLGVSQMFSFCEPACRNIFAIAKAVNPDTITVWGGTHPTVAPRRCLDCKDVDYIILGEGELPFEELLYRLNNNISVENMRSLAFSRSGVHYVNNDRAWLPTLDGLPLPDRDKLNMKKYINPEKSLNMISSRGCPYNCTFCTAPKMYLHKYRSRSPEEVVDEMQLLKQKYNPEIIELHDENLSCDMDRMIRIMDTIIERKLDIKWYSPAGLAVARLNQEIISKMKQAGYFEIRLAVESGDVTTLRKMKKPVSLSKVEDIVGWARDAQMRIISFILFGIPGESLEHMQNTASFCRATGFDWNVMSVYLPVPGSKIYDDLLEKGIEINIQHLEHYRRPYPGISDIESDTLVTFIETINEDINFSNNYNLCRGNINDAIADFARLTISYPDIEKMWYYLGVACYKAKDFLRSKAAFEEAYRINQKYKKVERWIKAYNTKDCTMTTYFDTATEAAIGYTQGHLSI